MEGQGSEAQGVTEVRVCPGSLPAVDCGARSLIRVEEVRAAAAEPPQLPEGCPTQGLTCETVVEYHRSEKLEKAESREFEIDCLFLGEFKRERVRIKLARIARDGTSSSFNLFLTVRNNLRCIVLFPVFFSCHGNRNCTFPFVATELRNCSVPGNHVLIVRYSCYTRELASRDPLSLPLGSGLQSKAVFIEEILTSSGNVRNELYHF